MKVLIVLFLAIATASAGSIQPIVPFLEAEGRITNGKPADIRDYPYQVGLANGNSWCGGTLISTTWVLTAAHCVNGASTSAVSIYLGSSSRAQGTKKAARAIRVHSGYNSNTLENDVAVVQIDAVGVTTNIKPATLPASTYNLAVGSTVVASGWGKTSDTSSVASTLQYADLSVISNADCTKTYGSIVKASTLCTSTKGGIGTCNGDSGGPLVVKGTDRLVGVVSFVASAGCTKDYPAGFARVTAYRDWIKQQTGV